MKKYFACYIFILLLMLVSRQRVYAQSIKKIVDVLTNYTTAAGSASYTDSAIMSLSGNYAYKFASASGLWTTQMQKISNFKISTGECFLRIPTPHQVKIRRVDNALVTGNTTVLWMEGDTTLGKLNARPVYEESMEIAFSSGYFNWGTDNLFNNAVPGTNNNNIERFDLIFPAGFTITDIDNEGFAIFERGVNGAHDPVKISGITNLNGTGDPNGYKTLPVTIATSDWGDIINSAVNHVVLRKQPGYLDLVATGFKTQDRGGIYIPFGALGFAVGDKVFGYSLMATDVNVTAPAQIINFSNSARFPLTTLDANGGIDLIGDVDIFRMNSLACVLPVVFSYVKTVNTDKGIEVQWQTLTEKDNARFEIEHSVDGINFEKIGTINSVKNFSSIADYSFLHRLPAKGVNYYRIKQVDIDGKYTYTDVVQVAFKVNLIKGMIIFPNPSPATDINNLYIKVETPGRYSFKIYNSAGQTEFSAINTTADGNIKLEGNVKFKGGYYTIQLTNLQTGRQFSSKLIVSE
jgi:hypothetical protein